jgi:very-short-patch-repair endonuclease
MTLRHFRVDPRLLDRARDMRHDPAPPEQTLWRFLRNRRLGGFKFRRQVTFDHYIADFCCVESKLIVELDGDSHAPRQEYDAKRTEWLASQGYKVIRFLNWDLGNNLEGVLMTILRACEDRSTSGPSP